MTALTAAAVFTLAASCQSVVAPATVLKIATVESGLDPAARHQNQDGTWDLGLMQVNQRNLSWLGLKDPFDPCQSIHAAANLLVNFSRYNTGSPSAGIANGYALKVTAIRVGADGAGIPALPTRCPDPDPTGWHATACRPAVDDAWHTTPHEKDALQ